MLRLSSGREVVLSLSPLIDQIKYGTEESVSAVILAYRLTVTSPKDLRDFATVGFLHDPDGPRTPENAYSSGFSVGDVLRGRAGWPEGEVAELRNWLETEPKLESWLADQFEQMNAAIRDSQVWGSPMWTDDDSKSPSQ